MDEIKKVDEALPLVTKNKDGTWHIPKTLLKCEKNRPYTQGLFLEFNYSPLAVFTFNDEDKIFKGKTYPSLKKLYLMHEDPIEIDFANTYLLGWNHWMRICENKIIRNHIDQWRMELELQIRSDAIRNIIDATTTRENFQAAKWLASRGWEVRGAGRPSKAELEQKASVDLKIKEEYAADIKRFEDYKR